MKYFLFFVFAALWIPNGCSPRNINELLDFLLETIFSEGIYVQNITLGDGNEVSDVKVSVSKDSKKTIGGEKWGLDMDLLINRLQITGKYHFVKIEIPGLFTLFGDGKFSLDFKKLIFKFNVEAPDPENVKVKNIFGELEGSQVMFENLFNDPSVAAFVCEILSNTLPDLVKSTFDEGVIEIVKLMAENIYKEILKKLSKNSKIDRKFYQFDLNKLIKKLMELKNRKNN